MGVYNICKWEVLFMGIYMGSNLSLRGVWGCSPRKFRNMKCSRSDSRPMLGLHRVSS